MGSFLRGLIEGLKSVFGSDAADGRAEIRNRPLPPIHFDRVSIVEKTPPNNALGDQDFIEVQYQGSARWVLFRCPCGCLEVVSLPLQRQHSPRWSVSTNAHGRPDLRPSVWRNKGCMSHFWIQDGRVFWTGDTGTAPWVAKPTIYKNRSNSVDFKA